MQKFATGPFNIKPLRSCTTFRSLVRHLNFVFNAHAPSLTQQGRLGGSSSSTRTMATTTQAPAGGATIAASPAWQALKEHVKAIEKT